MSEITQIVRGLGKGEFSPCYSTDELMRGVCHIVRHRRPTREERAERVTPPSLPTVKPTDYGNYREEVFIMLKSGASKRAIGDALGIMESSVSRMISNDTKLRKVAVGIGVGMACDRHFDTIKRMCREGKSTIEIAEEIGLSWSPVKFYIDLVKELRDIYLHKSHGQRRGGHNKSRANWEKNKVAILEALKTESFTTVRARFGFGYASFRSYLDEEGAES